MTGNHHIRFLKINFENDQHGLRERNVDHRDKKNFEAVLRIIKIASLLDSIPDAAGTKCNEMCGGEFLNKDLSPLSRIQMIWYANVFTLLVYIDRASSTV